MKDAILIVNAGSSSIKIAAYRSAGRPDRQDLIGRAECEGIGDRLRFAAFDGAGILLAEASPAESATAENALGVTLRWVQREYLDYRLAGAGHRVLHGGPVYSAPVLLTITVIEALHRLIPLAPLHQPHNLAAVSALATLQPTLPQVACFDTAFHHTQSRTAQSFALPRGLADEGVRRYGFHGLSYEYIASVLPDILGAKEALGRVVVAHLGSGASMCAMHGLKSVATTMSFSALDGLPMARRCGNLDPGVILYLLQEKRMTAPEISDLVYQQSGLLGVSGISDDMRVLLASDQISAKEAVDLFIYRIGLELGAMAAALGGIDALVFTAGVGEHAPEIRSRICAQAVWLGAHVDDVANVSGGPRISTRNSLVSTWIIPTDEDLMIARHAWDVLNGPRRVE